MNASRVLELFPGLVTAVELPYFSPCHANNESFEAEVRFSHFSVKKYLTSDRLKRVPLSAFAIDDSRANIFLAEICASYILQVTDSFRESASKGFFQLLFDNYAARHFMFHVAHSKSDWTESLTTKYRKLMDVDGTSFVAWTTVYDPDGGHWQEHYSCDSYYLELPSPIYYAAFCGSLRAIDVLIKNGCSPNDEGGIYGSALQVASSCNHLQVAEHLLVHGAEIDARGGQNGPALQAAASDGFIDIVDLLLKYGANVNAFGDPYGSALQAAAAIVNPDGKSIATLQLLLDRGAEVNASCGYFGSALQAAASTDKDCTLAVQLLLDHGAEVNTLGGYHGSALHAAAHAGAIAVAKLLLEHGADINAAGGRHGSVFEAAATRCQLHMMTFLLRRGVEVRPQDESTLAEGLRQFVMLWRPLIEDRNEDVKEAARIIGEELQKRNISISMVTDLLDPRRGILGAGRQEGLSIIRLMSQPASKRGYGE